MATGCAYYSHSVSLSDAQRVPPIMFSPNFQNYKAIREEEGNQNRGSRGQKEDRMETKNTDDKRMGNKEAVGNHANGKG